MLKFILTVDCNNSAFSADDGLSDNDDDVCNRETARLLREAAAKLEAGSDGNKLRDVNGNTVGEFHFMVTA